MGRLTTLSECLWDAFMRDSYGSRSPQDRRQMWALEEGIRRLDPRGYTWRSVQARKDHQCVRGCSIRDGERYFQMENGPAWGSELKFCAGCMGMILYGADVVGKPAYMLTHWDEEAQEPVNPEQDEKRRRSWQRLMQGPPDEQVDSQQKPLKLISSPRSKRGSSKSSQKPRAAAGIDEIGGLKR